MSNFLRMISFTSYCALFVFVSAASAAGPEFTDPEKAGLDFQIQGEYVGQLMTTVGIEPQGCQVLALGDGLFQVVQYAGGLPGAGWERGDEATQTAARRNDAGTELQVGDDVWSVRDGKLIPRAGGKKLGSLRKTHRESTSLGAEPPEGALVLFDGTSTDEMHDGVLVDDQYLGATNCHSKQLFNDHTLHLEFRTPFMPQASGQARGNSGVYVQSRYEVQVLDSFALEGENNECGGIYSISEPAVNMCLPPLSWQTYDIDFTAARHDDEGNKTSNARVTIRHNGVLIHNDVELTHGTPGRHPEGPEPDAVFLQDHGNSVVYRNIWAIAK